MIVGASPEGALQVTVAGVRAVVHAPAEVLAYVSRALEHAPAGSDPVVGTVTIAVERDRADWRIWGSSVKSRRVLDANSGLPQVSGAVITSLVAEIAATAKLSAWRAAALERDGDAVILVGDDWESCIVLAAHLHVRGWRLLGGDWALIDRETLSVFGLRKYLYASLSFVDNLPLTYRRAVEQSPWYSTGHDIAFYAVDPALARAGSPWADTAQLRALLKVDGHISDVASVERTAGFALDCGMQTGDLERAGVAVAEIKLGDYQDTCSLVERIMTALPTARENEASCSR